MATTKCRICLEMSDNLFPLFEDEQLTHKIATISSVWISIKDNLPATICNECKQKIDAFYTFRKLIIDNDLQLKQSYHSYITEPKCSQSPSEHTNGYSNDEVLKQEVEDNCKVVTRINVRKHKNNYNCDICTFTTTESSKFQNHRRTYHRDRGMCNVCGKYIRYENLGKHIKTHSESPIPCKECGKMFKNSGSLRYHTVLHTGQKKECKICGKIYRYTGEYHRHLKRHALNGVKTVKCTECDKMFLGKKEAKRHMQTHTRQRPHICQICTKGFSSTHALKTHFRQHTNEKPYICEYCSIGYPQKVSLMTHIKSKHSK